MNHDSSGARLLSMLSGCTSEEVRNVILLLSAGAAQLIKSKAMTIQQSEVIVFNTAILAFCRHELACADLVGVIGHGMEIDDIARFYPNAPEKIEGACDRLLSHIVTTIRRTRMS